MKMPTLLKKIDARVVQFLVMAVIIAVIIFALYHAYSMFNRYEQMKTGENQKTVKRPLMEFPEFFNFTPDDDYENIERYQLFSFEKKKSEKVSSAVSREGTGGSGAYRILGVVKKDRLFALVRFDENNVIRLVAEGMEIDSQTRVQKITTSQVILVDSSGGESIHKVFQEDYLPVAGNIEPGTAGEGQKPQDKDMKSKKDKNDKNNVIGNDGSGKP